MGLEPLLASGVIAVVRMREPVNISSAARALVAGGVNVIEITLTTPGALDAIRGLASDDIPGCVVGVGSVLDEAAAQGAVEAGARFVVMPVLRPAVIRWCRDRDVPCLAGALTPTEILDGWQAGAAGVKVFPAAAVGPGYFRDVLAPLPFLRLVPSGGVSLGNAAEWIDAGAAAVSVGSALVAPDLVRRDAAAELTARARALVQCVAEARRRRAS